MTEKSKTILLDGGMGRQLARMGAPFRQPEWSALALMEAPATVADGPWPVHRGRGRGHHHQQLCPGSLPYRRGTLRQGRGAAGRSLRPAGAAGGGCCRASGQGRGFPAASFRLLSPGSVRPGRRTPAAFGADRGAWRPISTSGWWRPRVPSPRHRRRQRRRWPNRRSRCGFPSPSRTMAPIPPRRSCAPGETPAAAVEAALALGAEAVLFNCSQPEVMGAAIAAARPGGRTRRPAGAAHRGLCQCLPAPDQAGRGQCLALRPQGRSRSGELSRLHPGLDRPGRLDRGGLLRHRPGAYRRDQGPAGELEICPAGAFFSLAPIGKAAESPPRQGSGAENGLTGRPQRG